MTPERELLAKYLLQRLLWSFLVILLNHLLLLISAHILNVALGLEVLLVEGPRLENSVLDISVVFLHGVEVLSHFNVHVKDQHIMVR